jgi:hypothetical protein
MEARLILYLLAFLLLIVGLIQTQQPPYDLPKVIWTHWDMEPVPQDTKKTVERMQKMLPDWKVNFLTTDTLLSSINQEEIPPHFSTLRVEAQSDWIRLKLLKKYGGCWMDSGIILNQSINNLYLDCVRNKADLLAFKILGKQSNPKYPVAESWFLMAPPESPVVTVWLEEFERAIQMKFKPYKRALQEEGVDLQKIMVKPNDTYLMIHSCFQKVIQQRMPPNAKIVYHTAEDTMFKLHAKVCKWDQTCISKKLQDVEFCRTIPYIKLRGVDRKKVNILPLLD